RRRVAPDVERDRHLAEARRRRVGEHVAARVELGARDRLEAVIGHAEFGRIKREYCRVAADRAGDQEFERRRRALLPAHVRRLADEKLAAALLALDQFVELPDRAHLHLDEALRSLGRGLLRITPLSPLPP